MRIWRNFCRRSPTQWTSQKSASQDIAAEKRFMANLVDLRLFCLLSCDLFLDRFASGFLLLYPGLASNLCFKSKLLTFLR